MHVPVSACVFGKREKGVGGWERDRDTREIERERVK